jgi:hypothetical protein
MRIAKTPPHRTTSCLPLIMVGFSPGGLGAEVSCKGNGRRYSATLSNDTS